MFRPLRTPRVLAAALVLSTVTTGAVVLNSGASTSARVVAHAPTPACTAGGLVNWINTQPNGAAGTIYYQLTFTNLSGHTCTIFGYPGVSAVNIVNGQIGQPAVRSASPAPFYSLVQGASISAHFGVREAAFFPANTCHQTVAAGIRVYAPNQTFAKIIPFPFHTCNAHYSTLEIYPVHS